MKLVRPSEIKGIVNAPPSKSMTVRAIAAALLSEGAIEIVHPSFCGDALSALGIARAVKSKVVEMDDSVTITGKFPAGADAGPRTLECGESGLCMRMFTPIAALAGEEMALTASGSLAARPMDMVEQIKGHVAHIVTDSGFAPVTVKGPLRGGLIAADGAATSQFLTGLIMALPLCAEDSTLVVSRPRSVPYIKMTISLLQWFGIEVEHDEDYQRYYIRGNQTYAPVSYRVEGDWSGAAFLLVAGALGGSVKVSGLDRNSFQADRAITAALADAGAVITAGPDFISAERKDLRPFVFDATDAPDLFPPLVALAANCDGSSIIHGVERLKHKESDRAAALAQEFGKLGIGISISGNTMVVKGGEPKGGTVDSHNDHRIAMACAVAAVNGAGPVGIGNWQSVFKSYPGFFRDFASLQVSP